MPSLVTITRRLHDAVDKLAFSAPITHVYNPLSYAWAPHEEYLRRYGRGRKQVLLMGMNPGPYGMAQTGIPFGEVAAVRDFLQLSGAIQAPASQHPKRKIQGFECPRSEVSGRRLWGWAAARFGDASSFFSQFYVHNYCPLAFMLESGANFTPDKLPPAERAALYAPCDVALQEYVDVMRPQWVIGIGKFAEARATAALAGRPVRIGTVLHPSPASPAANRGWSAAVDKKLESYGLI